MQQSILVPLDGTLFGEKALPVALGIARRTGAALELVSANDVQERAIIGMGIAGSPMLAYPIPLDVHSENPREARVAYMESLLQRVRGQLAQVDATVVDGPVLEVLAEQARDSGVVVMSTHAWGGLRRILHGSMATELVREVCVPTVLVKSWAPDGAQDVSAARCIRRVLVPLDGSAFAESVLEPLLRVIGGDWKQVEVTLLRVLAAPSGNHNSEAEDYLDRVSGRLRAAGVQVKWLTVVHGNAGQAILNAARELEVDLIAMATHGHGGLRRCLAGSVADEVFRGGETATLLYRPEVS